MELHRREGKELGIGILPMPFFIDGEEYFEEITLSQEEFYERLKANHDIKTSQPAPGDVMGLWDKYLEEYDGNCLYSDVQRAEQFLRDCHDAGGMIMTDVCR